MPTKRDGRRHNGPKEQGLQQDAQLVTGPKELIVAMRKAADAAGISVREAWRRAAADWLKPRR